MAHLGPGFLYMKTLKRRDLAFDDLVFPKAPRKLPGRVESEEVTRLFEPAPNLMHRTILMALRRHQDTPNRGVAAQATEIDSERTVIRIHQGKGSRVRDVPMTPKLELREYRVYLFRPSPAEPCGVLASPGLAGRLSDDIGRS